MTKLQKTICNLLITQTCIFHSVYTVNMLLMKQTVKLVSRRWAWIERSRRPWTSIVQCSRTPAPRNSIPHYSYKKIKHKIHQIK